MEHLGILAHSTEGAALCLRAFCQEGFRALGPHDHPDVTLDCIALARSMPAWDSGATDEIRATLAVSVVRLAAADATFFVCPDNTAHEALERPGADLALPGLHIAEVVAEQAERDGRRRVGVLGTRYLMDGPVYRRALTGRGIAAEVPEPDDRAVVNRIIFDELVNGVLTDASRQVFRRVIALAGGPRVRRGRPGVHRDPPPGDPGGVVVADPGLDPAAGPGRLRGGRRRPPVPDLARRAGRRLSRRGAPASRAVSRRPACPGWRCGPAGRRGGVRPGRRRRRRTARRSGGCPGSACGARSARGCAAGRCRRGRPRR